MQVIRSFVREVVQAYKQKDKNAICDLISLDSSSERVEQLSKVLYDMTEASIRSTVAADCESLDAPRPLKDLITNYLIFTIASCLDTSVLADVYELLSTCYGSFLGLYTAFDAQWLTPLLMNISYSLVDWATLADKENPNAKELKVSDAAAKHLSRAFNIVISDKTSNDLKDSKKMALYYLANLTFRVYFKIQSTRLLPTMIANISKAGVKLEQYPMSQQVAHRYYLGRYSLYQLDLRSTERHLAFAFRNCPPQDPHDQQANIVTYNNARLCLIYLIAARLCIGIFPSQQLLQAYDLEIYFSTLARAIKLGDLGLLDNHLDNPQLMSWFVEKEIYFLLKEKLRVLCWRSLIRRVWLLGAGQPRVDLNLLVSVVQLLTKDTSFDIWDVECITGSLLDQGYIRGYIHSEKKILVVSKTNSFPPVHSVEVAEEYA
ncbi:hypothetical protein BGZ96_007944 [Linnemannia gamsii]|uniref:PCI domain-containing protein n=1 Tax=Linnemannia gamsii TaxID=64522 RepID=A0ABQ7K0F7_9FUNG|nr:hypothetical protein BGZ96_007944 [Linnemannia gamsii]